MAFSTLQSWQVVLCKIDYSSFPLAQLRPGAVYLIVLLGADLRVRRARITHSQSAVGDRRNSRIDRWWGHLAFPLAVVYLQTDTRQPPTQSCPMSMLHVHKCIAWERRGVAHPELEVWAFWVIISRCKHLLWQHKLTVPPNFQVPKRCFRRPAPVDHPIVPAAETQRASRHQCRPEHPAPVILFGACWIWLTARRHTHRPYPAVRARCEHLTPLPQSYYACSLEG